MNTKPYNAKILLFGEYTIIKGADALAIPINQFCGVWDFAENAQAAILQEDLKSLVGYLVDLGSNGALLSDMDLQRFKRELSKGLYFKSTIPRGYGAGSSGALCAAVYRRFCKETKNAVDEINLLNLKKQLAQLESFFHGASSGIDPLVSFINQPILMSSKQNKLVRLPEPKNSKGAIFLLDTGIKRKTEPFVKLFLEKCKEAAFEKICSERLTFYNEKAIQHFLAAQWADLFEVFNQISWLQLEYFKEMIPEGFVADWQKGLDGEVFKLKLCGAGGGGFILGFTEDFEKTMLAFPNEKLIPIFRV